MPGRLEPTLTNLLDSNIPRKTLVIVNIRCVGFSAVFQRRHPSYERSVTEPLPALWRGVTAFGSGLQPENESPEWEGGAARPMHNPVLDQFMIASREEGLPRGLSTQLALPSEGRTDSSHSPPSILALQQACH